MFCRGNRRFLRLPILSVVLVQLLFVFSACGKSDRELQSDEGDAIARRFLSIGTAPPGGAFFVVGGALAEVLNQSPEGLAANWQVTAEATKGTRENLRRLVQGELDFALANAAISYFAVRGESDWDSALPIRSVMTLAPNVALFVATKKSGIETVRDLAGKRVVLGPAGAGFEAFLRPILAAHGLSYDDLTPLHATQAGAVDLLADGAAAAAFLGGAVPTASITQAATTQDIVFVPFEDAAVESLLADFPFFAAASIPAATYRGQEEDFHGLNVGSMHLVTADAVDSELVYQVASAIWEGRTEVVEKHPAGRAIHPQVVVRDTGIPFHSGAERFYRDIGIWPAAASAEGGDGGAVEAEAADSGQ